jgi:hypothetical protein
MPALFDLLSGEDEACVRAVLGHFVFVYIHPYMDGNGRVGRFLMNVMLASGGYPWTIYRLIAGTITCRRSSRPALIRILSPSHNSLRAWFRVDLTARQARPFLRVKLQCVRFA